MAGDDRAVVKTYVPAHQKEQWVTHAEEMDMSLSEFLRSMVQAGRRGFLTDREEGGSEGSDPRGQGLEDRVLATLSAEGVVSWDQLVDELSGDFEDRLDETVQALSEAGEIRFDPRRDGFVLQEDA
ncbi:hypothetical protein HALDL1_08880 [Halobacterium sp. DL1]|jgi:hypothetical protein|nr:hypothetical protein HALDL1_08880 [Halobacterium sp. DL1]